MKIVDYLLKVKMNPSALKENLQNHENNINSSFDSQDEENVPKPVQFESNTEENNTSHCSKTNIGIPRKYSWPIEHIVKSHQRSNVQTIGSIRRKFEKEQIDIWSPILKTDTNFVAKCEISFYFSQKHKDQLNALLNNEHPITKQNWNKIRKILKTDKFYLTADCKRVFLPGCVRANSKNITYKSYKLTVTKSKNETPLQDNKIETKPTPLVDSTTVRKRGLLPFLNVDFKPGPLSKKPKLTHTNHDAAEDLQLMTIPPVGLEVFPRIGSKLDMPTCKRLNSVRNRDGYVDEMWARFATSVVESNTDENPVHTFLLPYANNQNRILFRRDSDFKSKIACKRNINSSVETVLNSINTPLDSLQSNILGDKVEKEVANLLEDVIKSVSLNEIQDIIGNIDNDYVPVESKSISSHSTSDSNKSIKKNRELSRLDVTVIDVSDQMDCEIDCKNQWCKLGCVCSSLQSSYMLNEHCGRIECMLTKCMCQFGKSNKNGDPLGISKTVVANLQNQINRYLSKEEQKFRRTVIRTNDDTIIIGAARRGQRLPKRYDDFLVSKEAANIKGNQKKLQMVNICLFKLPSDLKLVPFCMIHELYRCFCRGVMTYGSSLANGYFNLTVQHEDENVYTKPEVQHNSTSTTSLLQPQIRPLLNKRVIVVRKQADKLTPILNNQKFIENKKSDVGNSPKQNNCNLAKDETPPEKCIDSAPQTDKARTNDSQVEIIESDIKRSKQLFEEALVEPGSTVIKRSQRLIHSKKQILMEKQSDHFDNALKNQTVDVEKKRNCDSINTTNVKSLDNPIYKNDLLAEAGRLLQNPIKNVCIRLPKTEFRKVILYKWSKLVEDFQLNIIYLWVTDCEPYRVYATTNGKILCKQSCLPIVYGKPVNRQIILRHSSLKHLLCCDKTAFKYVAFVGRMFAWELLYSFEGKDQLVTTELMYPKIDSVISCSLNTMNPQENIGRNVNEPKKSLLKDTTEKEPEHTTENKLKSNDGNTARNSAIESDKNIICKPIVEKNNAHMDKEETIKDDCFEQYSTIQLEDQGSSSGEKPKYHWLSLHIGGIFHELIIAENNFKISYQDAMKAMMLADVNQKICKFPTGPLFGPQKIPYFGVYAFPKNKLQQIFLGPFRVGDKMNLKIYPKPVYANLVRGKWTKQLNDPRLIVWRSGCNQSPIDSVFFIGETIPKSGSLGPAIASKQKLMDYMKKSLLHQDESKVISKPTESTDQTRKPEDHKGESEDENDDEEVIFIPNENTVIELSDVED